MENTNNIYMQNIGTEENPEFLYPEELDPAIIVADLPKRFKRKNRRELRKKIWKSIKDGNILEGFNALTDEQKDRGLEVALKYSSGADPEKTLKSIERNVTRHPFKAWGAFKYIYSGEGANKFHDMYNNGYNGLFGPESKNFSSKNGIVDAMLTNVQLDSRIGEPTDTSNFGSIPQYIKKNYPQKIVQFVETNPKRPYLNQTGIKPIEKTGASGSFRTSMDDTFINNQGFTLEKGVRNDSTFFRGLDVYDFKTKDYVDKWLNGRSEMIPIIDTIDSRTTPVAMKTPWVYESDINYIIGNRNGLGGFDWSTVGTWEPIVSEKQGGTLNQIKLPLYLKHFNYGKR